MSKLYLCHTAYQVLIALVRALRDGGGQSIVLTAAIPDAPALAERLKSTGAFAECSIVDESRYPGVAPQPLQHWRNRRAFEAACGWKPNFSRYDEIFLCNDWSVLGRYLQDCAVPYTLCEDTVGGTLDPDQHLLDAQRAEPDFADRQRSGKGWLYWGDSKFCTRVESENAAECRLFPAEKLTTFSKKALLAGLSEDEKAAVRAAFLTQPLPDRVDGATLLLPRSFVLDGLMDQPTQDAMFRAVAKNYAAGPLFIKTHPRDETDYKTLFPDAVVLDRKMPSEVLNFCLPFRFARAVTVQSWVLRGFTAADETVFVSLDDAKALVKNA